MVTEGRVAFGAHLVRSLLSQGSEAQLRLAAAAQALIDLVNEVVQRFWRALLAQEEGGGGVGAGLISCPQQVSTGNLSGAGCKTHLEPAQHYR